MPEARTTLKMPENLPNHSELRRMMKIPGPLMFQTPKNPEHDDEEFTELSS